MKRKAWKTVDKAWVLPMMAACLFAASCQEDKEVARDTGNGEISFSVVDEAAFSSRAGEGTSVSAARKLHEEWITCGKDSLSLTVTEERNKASLFAPAGSVLDKKGSRATPLKTNTLNSFFATGYLSGNQLYFQNDKVELNDGSGSNGRYWPENELDIFAYAVSAPEEGTEPTAITFSNDEGCVGTFSYTLPEPDDDKEDALKQADLIFAMAPGQTKETDGGKVNLEFHHALSAVVFKLGTMPQPFTIKSITLSGILSSGSCTVSHVDGGNGLDFEWKVNTPKTYVQSFDDKAVGNGEDISGNETTFLLLPQKLSGDAGLTIVFAIGDNEYTIEKSLSSLNTKEWKADTRYTYVISGPDEVEVEIEEDFEEGGSVKKNVKFQNTGLAASYMRAVIVGYWVNENGDIVASWKADDAETGTFSGLPGNGWFKGNDGFYYHSASVSSGEYTSPLFTSYTLVGNPPIVGASLELNIMVQAVEAETTVPWEGTSIDNNNELTESN